MTDLIREPGSALTHFAGVIASAAVAFPLMFRALLTGDRRAVIATAVFTSCMFLLYTASTLYHSVCVKDRTLRIFRKIDHMMIFVMIAGCYTPFCLLVLDETKGWIMLAAVWILALAGMITKGVWITCPKWFSSVIYILMGWICVFVFGDLVRLLPHQVFLWLLAGGIIYTAGGIIYACRIPLFPQRKFFGNHELFHVFVLAGSLCHFIAMYTLLAG
ncbi:MAG: hemolysin III family protein [Lachnospiraceae bacterium]|nr:hemolysin III family protein [Lachnospiraceae bacterium]